MKIDHSEYPKLSYNIFGYILIPVVGLFISLIFITGSKQQEWVSVIRYFVYGIVVTTGVWSGCMLIVSYLWHKYPWQYQPFKHLVIEAVTISIYTIIFTSVLYWINCKIKFITCRVYDASGVFQALLITYFITSLHEAIFFYGQWKYNFSKSVQLENQHLKAKYESLKTQINPHYLFNGLNNLVSIVDDNPLALEYIQQMSSFLRYMLKSRKEELVSLKEEKEMLNKYVYLHQIRYGEILIIEMDDIFDVEDMLMPPLTLQMLFENCIKHNVISKSKPLTIKLQVETKGMWVINNRNPKNNVESNGKGLENIKERYRYFTKSDIQIIKTEDYFKVWIPLVECQGHSAKS